MRFNRLLLLGLTVGALAGCDGDPEIITSTPPPVAGVKYIHALSDTGNVDIRMIDQLQWSAFANALKYLDGTVYQPTEAKSRHIRVFMTDTLGVNASKIITDENITFIANERYTLLLTGAARAGTARFQVYADNAPRGTPGIAIRAINAGPAPVDVYFANTAADPLPAQPAASNVGPLGTTAYLTRATGNVHVRFTAAGTTTVLASVAGPAAPPDPTPADPANPVRPAAGVNRAGSVFTVVFFPAQAAPRTGAASGGFFVDVNPGEP